MVVPTPHVVISLLGFVSGFVLIRDFPHSRFRSGIIWIFLISTTLTILTGYLFHRDQLLQSHVIGAITLLVLVPTWMAWRPYCLFDGWRRTFEIGVKSRLPGESLGRPLSATLKRRRLLRSLPIQKSIDQ